MKKSRNQLGSSPGFTENISLGTKTKRGKPDRKCMEIALAEALKGMREGEGGPFGALIVKQDKIIARGHNQVLSSLDPTAHAEIVVIREACRKLGVFNLEGCELYTSCEPCPMCLGAAYWARVDRIIYSNTRQDAEAIGFGDYFIYREMEKPIGKRNLPMIQFLRKQAGKAFREWVERGDKIHYGPLLKK